MLDEPRFDDADLHERVTIGDVAERAGVSIATVSRVVNSRYGVAPATFEKVKAVIDDLGYESSLIARSLRSQRTHVIGVLVADIEPFSAEVLKGAANALRGGDYELVVYSGGHGGDHVGWERRYVSRLSGTLTDGTVLVTPTVAEVSLNQPVVAVDPQSSESAFPTFASQNYEGALTATRHLIELGHRRIGFLGGRRDLESARLREQGYRDALHEAGIEFDAELVLEGGFKEATAAGPARQLLALADRPSAVFAANDLSAIQTMRTAQELGLRVPDDLSVIGFDNVPESALTHPPLTTVDQSIQALGFEAVRTLIALIEQPALRREPPSHVSMPTKLVVRQSTAAPRAATA
ncbi:MAG: LacI family DNA-binding transcriptional regulator [Actinomycetota bacterium]|nr:LacI family DNA-binding transcriptional regulator [Actinomycetota bacterium]